MFNNSDRYVLNNSVDDSCDSEYKRLFQKYNFTEFKEDNLGICGGRQFIADHFDTTSNEYMIFFEDDMGMNDYHLLDKSVKMDFLNTMTIFIMIC